MEEGLKSIYALSLTKGVPESGFSYRLIMSRSLQFSWGVDKILERFRDSPKSCNVYLVKNIILNLSHTFCAIYPYINSAISSVHANAWGLQAMDYSIACWVQSGTKYTNPPSDLLSWTTLAKRCFLPANYWTMLPLELGSAFFVFVFSLADNPPSFGIVYGCFSCSSSYSTTSSSLTRSLFSCHVFSCSFVSAS